MKKTFRYNEISQLPFASGIYYLQEEEWWGWKTRYIGQSVDIHSRWRGDGEWGHQYKPLWKRNQRKMRLRIAPCDPSTLDYREAIAIQGALDDGADLLNIQIPTPEYNLAVFAEDLWRNLPNLVTLLSLVTLYHTPGIHLALEANLGRDLPTLPKLSISSPK